MVVGIKYDFIKEPKVPKSQQVKVRPPVKKRPPPKPAQPSPEIEPSEEPTDSARESNDKLEDLKTQVRKALHLLEDGKTVAGYNLLKRVVDAKED